MHQFELLLAVTLQFIRYTIYFVCINGLLIQTVTQVKKKKKTITEHSLNIKMLALERPFHMQFTWLGTDNCCCAILCMIYGKLQYPKNTKLEKLKQIGNTSRVVMIPAWSFPRDLPASL